eukprot:6184656-Pleurochrysis_carterae.AAC.1
MNDTCTRTVIVHKQKREIEPASAIACAWRLAQAGASAEPLPLVLYLNCTPPCNDYAGARTGLYAGLLGR